MSADLSSDKLIPIKWGLIYNIVCCPANWDADRVSDEASTENPPGTSLNRWVVSSNERLDADHPFKNNNPCPCDKDANRKHWLLNC